MGRNGLLWQSWCHSLGRVDPIYITHFYPFFCLLWRNLPWFLKALCGTIQPVGHEIHKSFNSLIQEKFQRWVLQTRFNETMPSIVFFSGQDSSQKGKGQVEGNVCRQSCASLALAPQMFHIPCRPERNPEHPEAMLPDSKTLWSRLTLIVNLTQSSCIRTWGLGQDVNCIFTVLKYALSWANTQHLHTWSRYSMDAIAPK